MDRSHLLTILHLSDLHFGRERDQLQCAERRLVLEGLLRTLGSLEPEWRPDCVCITGDLGWAGRTADYQEAGEWLRRLLHLLGIGADGLLLCPGNHDVYRELARDNARPSGPGEADQVLRKIPPPQQYQMPFSSYADFCRGFGVPSLRTEGWDNWLVGCRAYHGVHFVCLNSAWFSKDDGDKGQLWIGQPQVKHMEACGQLWSSSKAPGPATPPTVVLLHHPESYLHESECQRAGGRTNTMDYLAGRCQVLLTGHTHGEPRRADRRAQQALHLTGGATYSGHEYYNSVRLIRIAPDHLVFRCLQYDPGSSDYSWRDAFGAEALSYSEGRPVGPPTAVARTNLSVLREKTAADAQRLVEAKSRALRRSGDLPRTVPLAVSVRDRATSPRFGQDGRLAGEPKQSALMPLFQATRQSRSTLLLGDLGTGKSTLSGTFVIEVQEQAERALAFLAIAKRLVWQEPLTVKSLLAALSQYLRDQVAPEADTPDLEQLLRENVELAVVVDGLDEIPAQRAGVLLNQLACLSQHWPNIQVLAAARPVELLGVSYADWQIVATAPLHEQERMQFFQAEAVADGLSEQEAMAQAQETERRLRSQPMLQELADSPLAARLLYSRLVEPTATESWTLGDLLLDLLKERLELWARRDEKSSALYTFQASFPDAWSRLELLGDLAVTLLRRGSMTEEQAVALMREWFDSRALPHASQLPAEALDFFRLSGLFSPEPELQFSLQPFFEFACGYGIAAQRRHCHAADAPLLDPDLWRSVSFAATVARRLGWIEDLRGDLEDFIRRLLADRGGITAASYIVSELKDTQLAQTFVELLGKLGRRPIAYVPDRGGIAPRAIAEALSLAGRVGFDWLFEHYLDPRYPITGPESGLIHDLTECWVRVSLGRLTEHEKERLKLLVLPHVEGDSSEILTLVPLLSLAVPEALDLASRLWFSSRYLDDDQFSVRVTESFETAHSQPDGVLANQVLAARVGEGYEQAASAAGLWLRLNPGVPPFEIIRGILRALGRRGYSSAVSICIRECVNRLGDDAWRRLLRWYLFDGDQKLAAGAALELHRRGEKRLSLLGEPVLAALHDGGYVREAEVVLEDLVSDGGAKAVHWLAERIGAADSRDMGAPSACWRVFLNHLPAVKRGGPGLLAGAARGVGCFLLPRYPEVRQQLRGILDGEHGSSYVETLRSQLVHFDPVSRHGVAMVLVACLSPADSEALEIVARSRTHRRLGSWWEWEQFCLTLSFGRAALADVCGKLPDLDPLAEAFVLAVLNRNGVRLDDREFAKLVTCLQELDNWSLDRGEAPVLASERALPVLKQLAEDASNPCSQRAAENLLEYHRGSLSRELYARCIGLTVRGDAFRLQGLQDAVESLLTDADFAAAVRDAAAQIVASGGERPLLGLVLAALEDDSGWRDVLWRMLCDTSGTSDHFDDCGNWLLDHGMNCTEHSRAIGLAARELLEDPRVRQSRYSEPHQWLTLLADEFAGLPRADVERALAGPGSIHRAVDSALIARLGHVPSTHHRRRSVGSVPVLSDLSGPQRPSAQSTDALLREATRASDITHPGLCPLLEELAVQPPLSTEELDRTAAESMHGALAAAVLSFVFGYPPDERLVMRLLGAIHWRPDADDCFRRLVRAYHSTHYRLVAENSDARDRYVSALNGALTVARNAAVLPIAAELLSLRGKLEPSQIEHVFQSYAGAAGFYHDHGLGDLLSRWLSRPLDSDVSLIVTRSAERALRILDEEPWDIQAVWPSGAVRFLVLPLVYWRFAGALEERSIRVFQRGLRFLFTGMQPRHPSPPREQPPEWREAERLDNVVRKLQPLISAVPASLLREAIARGAQSSDLVVRAVCHLLLAGFTPGQSATGA